MAEAIAVIGFVTALTQLAIYGSKVCKRLEEFQSNVKELPSSFLQIKDNLPLLLDIVRKLSEQAEKGSFDPQTQEILKPVIEGLHKEVQKLDAVLQKILPTAKASTWEKGVKAVKSMQAQKDIDDLAAVVHYYVSNLTAFQTTHNSDQIRKMISLLESQHLEPIPADPAPEYTPTRSPIRMLKYENDLDFVGRDSIIKTVEDHHGKEVHRVALAGIGGVGKSRIAIQYCYRYIEQNRLAHIFWIYGGSKIRFETDYQRVARALNLPGWEDGQIDTLRLVCDSLSDERNGPWLMVLDSADDYELWLGSADREASNVKSSMPLIDYLPRGSHGRILITTRDSQLGHRLVEGKKSLVPILRLELEDARSLLSAKLSEEKELSTNDADELTTALEFLPLTITQAAAYLKEVGLSASEYLELFRAGQLDIPDLLAGSIDDPSRDRETPNSVFLTWRLSFDQISRQSPTAANILSLMAVLDRQAIPQELLKRPEDRLLEFKAAISKLKAFSLISEEKSSSKYGLHRLVQLSTRKWLEHHGVLPMWQEAAVSALARHYPSHVEYKVWPLMQDLNSHVQIVLQYDVFNKSCQIDRASILHSLGHYCMEQGENTSALELLFESRSIREEHLGLDHEDTLTSSGLHGVMLSKTNRLNEAQKLQIDLVARTKRVLGLNHRLTLKSMSRLAIGYNKRNEYRESQYIQQQVLIAMEAELGADHKDTLQEMNNLATTYNKLSHLRRAEDLGLRALNLRTQALGATHPDTLTGMAALAWTYRLQLRWQEAEELERKVLEYRTEILGLDHPKTMLAMGNLAETLEGQNQLAEAETLRRRTVEAQERVLGQNHYSTKRAKKSLAKLEALKKGIDNGETRNPPRWHRGRGSRGARGGSFRGDSHRFSVRGSSRGPQHPRGRGTGLLEERADDPTTGSDQNKNWRLSADWRKSPSNSENTEMPQNDDQGH